jgi:hypothetical protein
MKVMLTIYCTPQGPGPASPGACRGSLTNHSRDRISLGCLAHQAIQAQLRYTATLSFLVLLSPKWICCHFTKPAPATAPLTALTTSKGASLLFHQ